MNDHGHGSRRYQGHRSKIARRIVSELPIERRIDGLCADRAHEEGITVRGGARNTFGTDVPARPAAVVHQDLLAQLLRELLRKRPRNDIGGAAGRKGHDQPKRVIGIIGLRQRKRAPQCEKQR